MLRSLNLSKGVSTTPFTLPENACCSVFCSCSSCGYVIGSITRTLFWAFYLYLLSAISYRHNSMIGQGNITYAIFFNIIETCGKKGIILVFYSSGLESGIVESWWWLCGGLVLHASRKAHRCVLRLHRMTHFSVFLFSVSENKEVLH